MTLRQAQDEPANPVRGEAALPVAGSTRRLRPTFAALVAAEDELGPLFALVERAGAGQLRLSELAALFWHCLAEREGLTRDDLGEAVMALGLAGCAAPLRVLLGQILQGRPAAEPG
ncbi:MAG: gene transfer agent family protein [Croceibacterium sp.]